VSVVVPFAGYGPAAASLVAGLRGLELRDGDEVIVVDNSAEASVTGLSAQGSLRVVRATREHSSYHARNAGAETARNAWLLFMDADCRPDPRLLDRYFEESIPDECGIVAGAVIGAPGQPGILPAWARSRRQLSEEHLLPGPRSLPHPAAGTPNVLVRRAAFDALGGFHEGIRSGGDVELSWRIQDAGWSLFHRPGARVEHRYRRRLRSLMSQSARHAAGRRWLVRRYPGAFSRPRLVSEVGRSLAGALLWPLLLQPRRGLHKLIDGVAVAAGAWGWWFGRNGVRPAAEPPLRRAGSPSLVVITDAFPARSETFVYNEALALKRQGWALRVESLARPARTERAVARVLRIDYFEDDALRSKAAAVAGLIARHPLRCLRDRRDSRRWRKEEEVWPLAALAPAARRLGCGREQHLHAHFAAGGALVAMRLSRLAGVPYSVTAHAYDIFRDPANLTEKLEQASFAVAECDYAADHLRALVSPQAAPRIHRIRTGADASFFARRKPSPGTGRVVAIGRLVEKKGFEQLLRAAVSLRRGGVASEVAIAGEGPLGPSLRALASELDLDAFVRFLGPAWGPAAVRDVLEGADVLAIPSVVAPDGDRDALPLVAYEALAMEVPIVASDLVGLPEVVRAPWGRLVPPGDPEELAQAIAEVLSQPAQDRAAAAREGRRFLFATVDPQREAERLAELIAGS
jgi:colanic acid/amylovoran biosynthesis glycosyltransferase